MEPIVPDSVILVLILLVLILLVTTALRTRTSHPRASWWCIRITYAVIFGALALKLIGALIA